MYGVALAGGGARGAYEIGVWKALMEMDIKVGAVCGTSIGSINAAMFAQGDFGIAEEVWRNISISDVVDTRHFADGKLISVKNIGAIIDEIRKNKGISLDPLETLLRKIIKEDKLMLSPVDFGLVTYSVSDNSLNELFKADIPRGKLVDYLMASSRLPGIKAKVIDDKVFLDGGVADNMPVTMLAKKGYRDIIAVDVGGVGIVKPVAPCGVNIINIRCRTPLVNVLDFEQKSIIDSIECGYLDAKRAFGKLSGEIYPIRTYDYIRSLGKYSKELLGGLEKAAELLGIDKLREYTVASLSRAVVNRYRKMSTDNTKTKISADRVFVKVCDAFLSGNADSIAKIAAASLKRYTAAANAVCYFAKKLP